jgi:hypothetical protein
MAEIKRFNWVRRPTSWESVQAWRTQSSSVTQRFLSDSAAANTSFFGAQNNLASGMANLAAQASLQRVQAEIKAKSQSALTANSVNQLA